MIYKKIGTIGKWGAANFVFGVIITVFVLGGNNFSHAYTPETIISNQQQSELKLDLNSISKVNNITAPIGNLINKAINGLRFDQNVNMDTGIPISSIKSPSQQTIDFSRFFGSSNVSSNDVLSFLKEAIIMGINLSIVIISITAQILKGLLSVLNSSK